LTGREKVARVTLCKGRENAMHEFEYKLAIACVVGMVLLFVVAVAG